MYGEEYGKEVLKDWDHVSWKIFNAKTRQFFFRQGVILNVLSHGEAQRVMSGGQGVWEQTELERLGRTSSS